MSISNDFKKFCERYQTEVNSPLSSGLESYDLLVRSIPNQIQEIINSNGLSFLKVKGSIGQGVTTSYPWLGIFDKRVSTGATNGYYVVCLLSDDFKDMYLTLNQGSTLQSTSTMERNEKFVFDHLQNIEGFEKGTIPANGLVKIKPNKPENKGAKYEKTTMFYKKYKVENLIEDQIVADLLLVIKHYQDCVSAEGDTHPNKIDSRKFYEDLVSANLVFPFETVLRFISLLCTKPFVILTGLSGSRKTKLAQAFAKWISVNNNQVCVVPIGADWTNREPLLGYPNALETGKYVKPNTGVLDLVIEACKDENHGKPYFLILDEMNLSHVERYFADFLSVIESGEDITLHAIQDNSSTEIPSKIHIPDNLFIIGTVNVDETTYMFSPKVLDRAGVIEFRVNQNEMDDFLGDPVKANIGVLVGKGVNMGESFVEISTSKVDTFPYQQELKMILIDFFIELKKLGSEFGYRTASEIFRFGGIIQTLANNQINAKEIADAAIVQKLLPKIHGSRRKLEPVIKSMIKLCLDNSEEEVINNYLNSSMSSFLDDENVRYPISFEKLLRMYKHLIQDGFTSFAEA